MPKLCPLMFVGMATVVAVDPLSTPEVVARGSACKGSHCMMWRTMNGNDGGAGYCGLADRPAPGEAVPDPQHEVPDAKS